jgi:hypothetical protein
LGTFLRYTGIRQKTEEFRKFSRLGLIGNILSTPMIEYPENAIAGKEKILGKFTD